MLGNGCRGVAKLVLAFKEIIDYLKISEMNMRIIAANVDSVCTNL